MGYGPPLAQEAFAYLLIEGDPSFQLTMQTLPESLSEEKSPVYASIPIPGRTEPYRVYMGGQARRLTLPLIFVASFDEKDAGTFESVKRNVAWCRSLCEPDVDGDDPSRGLLRGPPILRFIYGDLYDMRCIATSYSCTLYGPWSVYGEVAESELSSLPNVSNNVIDNFFRGAEAAATQAIKSAVGLGKDKVAVPAEETTRSFPALHPLRAVVQLGLEEVQLIPTTSRMIRRGLLL